jgi:hypothetical protein
MPFGRTKLVEIIIQKKLYADVEQILTISNQGFDVYVKTEFQEIQDLLLKLLNQELQVNPRGFRIISSIEELKWDHHVSKTDDIAFIPTILIGTQRLEHGYGFVCYEAQTTDQLIGNVAACVQHILKYFCLEFYLDVFEGSYLSRLKQIARVHGLKLLIDAVVQTAYLGGFKGNGKGAEEYLDHLLLSTEPQIKSQELSTENCAKVFLSHAIAHGENAHSFLKSCLGYHIVNNQGYNMSRASQVLNISRTTLQEHLKIAEELKVSSFFDGRANF